MQSVFHSITVGCVILGTLVIANALPKQSKIKDVPEEHWAAKSVNAVVSANIMKLESGKFNGSAPVNRKQLALILAEFGKSIESGTYPAGPVSKLNIAFQGKQASPTIVNRYQVASVLDKIGKYIVAKGPKPAPVKFGKTVALPPADKITGVGASDPSYLALQYLTKKNMIFGKSFLLHSGPENVTSSQLAEAVSMVVVGAIDQNTDEPELREPIAPRPAKK